MSCRACCWMLRSAFLFRLSQSFSLATPAADIWVQELWSVAPADGSRKHETREKISEWKRERNMHAETARNRLACLIIINNARAPTKLSRGAPWNSTWNAPGLQNMLHHHQLFLSSYPISTFLFFSLFIYSIFFSFFFIFFQVTIRFSNAR